MLGRHHDLYATLGGWPIPNADDDGPERLGERLLAVTVMDCEPWIEAWEAPDGRLHAVQRIA